MEVELKLLIDPKDVAAFRQHPSIKKYAQGAPVEQEQHAIYFDTADHALRRADAGLRVRKSGKSWTQTLKAGGSVSGGLHQRHEWESMVRGPEPDLYALRKLIDEEGPWEELIASPKFAGNLRPIFTTDVRRTTWQLRLPTGDQIECVLDEGKIANEDKSDAVSEIELELKSGDPLRLFDFALHMLEQVPMHIGNQSKAERGYALSMDAPSIAVKARSLVLSKKMTIEQAFEAIVDNCLQQIQANVAGVAQSDDVDSLHQMRIGLRRLRSALALFEEMIEVPEELRQELSWLSDEISTARDWDVFATKTLAAIDRDAADVELGEVKKAALEKAAQLHRVAAQAINSVRYTRLVLAFSRWIQSREWREPLLALEGKSLKKRLKSFSTDLLKHDKRRLTKRGRQLEEADSHARHRVRIAAKRMRYDTEFFQSLYPAKDTKAYVTALSDLQDKLGWLNDVAVGERLLTELQDDQSELAGVAGYIRGYLAALAARDEKKVEKLWKKFKDKSLPK
jgi:inorganic triphosphatase YgiF